MTWTKMQPEVDLKYFASFLLGWGGLQKYGVNMSVNGCFFVQQSLFGDSWNWLQLQGSPGKNLNEWMDELMSRWIDGLIN